MKKILLSVVLILGFLINTGFSNGPEKYTTFTSEKDSSTTLEVKFQSPRLIISDQRVSENITNYFKERDSLTSTTLDLLDEIKVVMQQDQERRYESALDYLSRETGLSSSTIQSNINNIIKTKTMLRVLFSIIVLLVLSTWWFLTRKLLIDWQQRFVQLGIIITFLIALYILYGAILRIITPYEYHFLHELINLSG